MIVSCINIRKEFVKRHLLHRGDADDLQNFPEGVGQVLPLLGDGDEQIGAQRRPDLHPHAVGRGAEGRSAAARDGAAASAASRTAGRKRMGWFKTKTST